MQDLALYIIKQLVNNPDDVSIEEQNSGQGEITLLVSVNPEDMGIVIGKSGQTIKAVRRILSIRAMTENVRVNLQLVEPEGSERRKSGDGESDKQRIGEFEETEEKSEEEGTEDKNEEEEVENKVDEESEDKEEVVEDSEKAPSDEEK
jgi:uncharacterized protein